MAANFTPPYLRNARASLIAINEIAIFRLF
jgi:hypothetical protein